MHSVLMTGADPLPPIPVTAPLLHLLAEDVDPLHLLAEDVDPLHLFAAPTRPILKLPA
jgi:hypothetical protein